MKDRIPRNPGRVLITPEIGSAFYATVARADNPFQEGTPLNKETLLTDETAEFLGLTSGDPTVSEAIEKLGTAMSIETVREICEYGAFPSGYTLLDYIKSEGDAYIDTGVIPTNNTKIEVKASVNTGNFYAAVTGTSRFGLYLVAANSRIDMAFGSTGYMGGVLTGLAFPAVVTMENGKITANDSVYTFTEQSAFTAAYTLPLFGQNAGTVTTIYGECYYCKIYESGVLIRDFVPCINRNGKYGMYDKVNDQFYSSAGNGSFTGA